MAQFRRTAFIATLFFALLAPLVILLLTRVNLPANIGAGSQPAAFPRTANENGMMRGESPVFVAGDSKTLWVVQPVKRQINDKEYDGFQLLGRESNSSFWGMARDGSSTMFQPAPVGLAVIGGGKDPSAYSTYVFHPNGDVSQFRQDGYAPVEGLSPTQKLLAAVGTTDGLFAMTSGPSHASTQKPGDRLQLFTPVDMRPGSLFDQPPAPANPPAPTTTTQPTTRPSEVGTYWFKDSHWIYLPRLGMINEIGSAAPGPGALVTVVVKEGTATESGTLIAAWVAPGSAELTVRALDYKLGAIGSATWSKPAVTPLPEAVPASSRLLSVAIDRNVYLFWTMLRNGVVELHGGRLAMEGTAGYLTLPQKNMLSPLPLGELGKGISAANDVAIGPTENSIAVVVSTNAGNMQSMIFDGRGMRIGGPAMIEPKSANRNPQIAQNIAMLLLLFMLALSLWQWRQQHGPPKIPESMMPAPIAARLGAFAIDFVIPFAIVVWILGLWENGGWQKIFQTWISAATQPDSLLVSSELLFVLGAYLLHVTMGELFFRRSLGKAIMGLQILMMDGSSPTVIAVFLRNLARTVELMPGVLLLYVFISPLRQRIGDVLARTVVLAAKSPEVPDDPDASGKAEEPEEVGTDSRQER